ncbi:DUF4384 domain-containing protein [Puniceibacterium sp. IMCC21224]|uniref:DUF4384 domain-containing protein n=1 Tax=Puniceibacterium sp. IMCC21224 TaxID=1618204 RepID=UPI00064DC4E3|nr:DUF4384 domain-containing protein [Puniceibacterium sp. IMCC21224]KMK65239.1 protein of unknown function (DUF4384) [Puniceibacterium sp. IMCC21224]
MSFARGSLALVGSLVLHLGAAFALVPWLAPSPMPQQNADSGRILLATMQVSRAIAISRTPDASSAVSAGASGARVAGQGVPQRRASPVIPDNAPLTGARVKSARQNAIAPPALRTGAAPTPAVALTEVEVQGFLQRAATPDMARVGAVSVPINRATDLPVSEQVLGEVEVGLMRIPSIAPDLAVTRAGDMIGTRVAARPARSPATSRTVSGGRVAAAQIVAAVLRAEPAVPSVGALPVSGTVANPSRPTGIRLAARAADTGRAVALDSAGETVQAGLEWSGAGGVTLDAQSLATLQAFLQPGAAGGRDVRDRMSRAMAAPDCARVHTVFDAATGTLELRGHVPDAGARAPLLANLRAQIGGALALRDSLQILPRPQCGLLDAIAALGLPQSEEQLTDSDLVGENAQVREYAFAEGDRLVIDLIAPEYPAYVYVDYFDASGQVLHLMPNDRTPLRLMAPDQVFAVGRGDDLDLRIAAPFGQDIAVAFAANRPLYDDLPPLVELAEPYLVRMRDRVADVRAADPEFRGEWVYLFVATSAVAR